MKAAVTNATIADLLPADAAPVVCAHPGEKLETVTERMGQAQVLSVPVRASDSPAETRCQAFFDVQDLLAAVLAGATAETTVGQVQNQSRTDVFMPVSKSLGLYPLTEIFSRGIHRVPVVDEEGRVEAVVSQSALLHFLAKHMHADETELDRSLAEAHLVTGEGKLVAVTPDTKLRDAFALLGEHAYNAVPIAGDGTLSVSTLRGMRLAEVRDALDGPVSAFVAQRPAVQTVAVEESCTVRRLISLMSEARGHRAWVTRDDGRVVAVVTLGDLIRYTMKIAGHIGGRRESFGVPK